MLVAHLEPYFRRREFWFVYEKSFVDAGASFNSILDDAKVEYHWRPFQRSDVLQHGVTRILAQPRQPTPFTIIAFTSMCCFANPSASTCWPDCCLFDVHGARHYGAHESALLFLNTPLPAELCYLDTALFDEAVLISMCICSMP